MLSPKYKIQQFALKQVLGYLKKDPENNLPKVMGWLRKFDTERIYVDQYDIIDEYLKDPENNWTKLMCNIINNVHPNIVQTVFTNFLLNASIRGWAEIQRNKDKYGHEIPFTILVDPTTACNKHCIGCWAADYNKSLNLSYDQLDKLFTEGKELGIYFYTLPSLSNPSPPYQFLSQIIDFWFGL